MKRFTQLFMELDQTTRTSDKVAALVRYFREAPPEDAAWALYLLSGRKLMRGLNSRLLRTWVAEETHLPAWMIDECYEPVGDLSETLALLLPDHGAAASLSLREVVEQRLLPLSNAPADQQHALLRTSWREFNRDERFLLHKLISGTYRVGASAKLVTRALAEVAGVSPAIMAHRLMGHWRPAPEDFNRLLTGPTDGGDPAQPYPFFLAYPLEKPVDDLGHPTDWLAEWKWDGIRAQLIRRAGDVVLWSRGEELINAAFPELVHAAACLPDGTVLDGEILAWELEQPLPFATLQRRLNRKQVAATFWPEVPVKLLVFDLLELHGRDLREFPLDHRRHQLETLFAKHCSHEPLFGLSPPAPFESWNELAALREQSRQRRAEGLMLKRRAAPYRVGRTRGDWWKWKVAPYTIDAVLIYAQRGTGKRATYYTDYTFGVWHAGELAPIAKAYSGLTDAEIQDVDRFVRRNTVARHGPVRVVKPELVFELAFEGIQRSDRHKTGLALRFPRMARWRQDKTAADADSLETVSALLTGIESR